MFEKIALYFNKYVCFWSCLLSFALFLLFHICVDRQVPLKPPPLDQNGTKKVRKVVLSVCFLTCWTLLVPRACTDDSQYDTYPQRSYLFPILPVWNLRWMEKIRQYWNELSRGASSQYYPSETDRKTKTVLKGAVTWRILPILSVWSFTSMYKRSWHVAHPPNTARLQIQIYEK